jgi:hypothetical protein
MGDGTRGSAASSGIDWSIFRDGEDDAFSWLLRSSSGVAAAASPLVAGADLEGEVLPLDDIAMEHDDALAALGGATVGGGAGEAVSSSSKLTAHALAARIYSGLRPSAVSVDGSVSLDDSDYYELDGEDGGDKSPGGKKATGRKRAAKTKRASKRKKSSAGSEDGSEQLDEGGNVDRKQLRREKNLVSVREFRKRKTKQLEQNEAKLRRLEAENMDLKMRLKIGKEALVSEQREKQQIKEQMREMLKRGASEHEIAQFLNMYKVTYSDYGPKRREKLHFHLDRIRELLLPTQVTKLCLYSVEQGFDMIARDSVIRDDPMAVPDSAAATMSLWGILAKELDVSESQQRQILERRAAIKQVRDNLNHTLSIVKQLEEVTDDKNTALEAQVAELQQILTPSQATKFIIWVKENPAFMYMLDKLVDSTLMTTKADAEAVDASESALTAAVADAAAE